MSAAACDHVPRNPVLSASFAVSHWICDCGQKVADQHRRLLGPREKCADCGKTRTSPVHATAFDSLIGPTHPFRNR